MHLNLFYTMVQKSQKWPKTQIKGGSCLNWLKMLATENTEYLLHYSNTMQWHNLLRPWDK